MLRVTRNIRQTEIARAWGCSRANIARIEAGHRPTPTAIEKYLTSLRRAESGQ